MQRTGMQIVIMCKAPLPGKVKTRLMSRYSADEAVAFHQQMAMTVIERARRLFADVAIAADDPNHPFFATFALPVVNQGEGDLGARMQRQIERVMRAGVPSVMLLGTDSPHMPDARLIAAAEALDNADIVLGPVEDGGYDLVAMHRLHSIFEGVAWSSDQVLGQTLSNTHRLGLSVLQLDTSFDVDFPADIERARQAGWAPDKPC